MTEQAADRRTAEDTHCAAAGKNAPRDTTGTGTDRGVLVLRRHARAATQGKHQQHQRTRELL